MTTSEITRRINNAKSLDFSAILNQCIELFKKVWLQGFIMLLLNLVLAIPIFMIIYIPALLFGLLSFYSFAEGSDPMSQTGLSISLILVLMLVFAFLVVAMSTISLGLQASFYRICKLKDLDQIDKEDYFYFLKKPYLGKTIKLGLTFTAIALVASLICFFPLLYAIVPLSFMVVVYAFNPDKSNSEIIKLAFEIGNKKWFISFVLIIVSSLLAMVIGSLLCGFGIFFTSAFSYLTPYAIYKNVVGFDEEDDQMKRIERLSIN